jgi:hypothetical protein
MLTEPKQPGQMADLMEWCKFWKDMDSFYGTEPGTPLQHDSRCEFCGH